MKVPVTYKLLPQTKRTIDLLALTERRTRSSLIDEAIDLLMQEPDVRAAIERYTMQARADLVAIVGGRGARA